jgi:hypothetical protein
MTADREEWLIVEAKRDDGTPTMFRIRELHPQRQLTKIFVVELPYPKTELSRLPNASDYRRLAEFEEQWLRPACGTLGWELVGSKTEDGSFFLYMYGATDPSAMIEKLSPFDGGLGFYDDDDPDWQEYGTLKELLDQAKAIPSAAATAAGSTAAGSGPAVAAMSEPTARVKPRRSASKPTVAAPTKKPATPKASAKTKPKRKAKAAAKASRKTAAQPSRRAPAKPKPAKRKRR